MHNLRNICLIKDIVSQIAPEVNQHGYLHMTPLSRTIVCCHTSFHAHLYKNVTGSSRLFRGFLFLKHSSRLMIWECFSIVFNVIRFNYACTARVSDNNDISPTDPHIARMIYTAIIYLGWRNCAFAWMTWIFTTKQSCDW